MAMAATGTSPFIPWDDFSRLRNSQDDLTKSEFAQINQRVDHLDQRIKSEFATDQPTTRPS
jgi:hypothetical protein